jgi:hypothetical protein
VLGKELEDVVQNLASNFGLQTEAISPGRGRELRPALIELGVYLGRETDIAEALY